MVVTEAEHNTASVSSSFTRSIFRKKLIISEEKKHGATWLNMCSPHNQAVIGWGESNYCARQSDYSVSYALFNSWCVACTAAARTRARVRYVTGHLNGWCVACARATRTMASARPAAGHHPSPLVQPHVRVDETGSWSAYHCSVGKARVPIHALHAGVSDW